MKTKLSLTLLLVLFVPFAAITGCVRNRTDEEIQNDRNRASSEDIDPGESLKDAGVTAKVRTRLVRDERAGALDLEDIDVVTREGVVILKGAVNGAQTRAAAEEIARATDGVSYVVNRIIVG